MRLPSIDQLVFLARLLTRTVQAGAPVPVSTEERLRNIPAHGLPVSAPVAIHWDAHQVPSIEASCDADLAVAIGVVHAHLRLAQMEAMRRLATGRIAEVIGPAGVAFDRSLRLMGFTRATPGILAMMPDATRRWAEAFVAGVNHHIAHAPSLPPEFALLGFAPAPWTLADLIAVGRLAATDISWLVFARLLAGHAALPAAEWDALWPLMQSGDTLPWPQAPEQAALAMVRGSNSAAVPASHSTHGAGMIASDPHLSVTLPPLWLIAGLHAPGLDAVGLMIPGLPVMGLGRNRDIAWGGTSLHAAASELVDVSAEPMTERLETVAVRGAAPVTIRLRETRFGPVVTDGMLLKSPLPLSLRWVGHHPSDEISALFGVLRARSFDAFRTSMRGFAVPGQTMVVVEAGPAGRAGRVIAAHLPRRPDTPMAALICPPDQAWRLEDLVPGSDTFSVGEDVVASANERPSNTPVPVGFFFAAPERARRLRSMLEGAKVSPQAMRGWALDVLQPRSMILRDILVARLTRLPNHHPAALRALREWDGRYDVGSRGALVFEVLTASLARSLLPRKQLALLTTIWSGRAIVADRIATAPHLDLRAGMRQAGSALRRYGSWGAVHRLSVRHPLAALPLAGRHYAGGSLPWPGGNDTLNKSGHPMVRGRHTVTFAACARHFSDMADPDANWFVLVGGQDGWLGSANTMDQVALWSAGEAIQVPLRAEAARAWPFRTTLRP